MSAKADTIIVKLGSPEANAIHKALASKQRVRLLALLSERVMNVNEIAAALGVGQPTASEHMAILQKANLIESEYVSTGKGAEKRCWAKCSKIIIEADFGASDGIVATSEVSMPIGLFTAISVEHPCGMYSEKQLVYNFRGGTQSLLLPNRAQAQNIYFTRGWIEYTFPCNIPSSTRIVAVEFSAEIFSEVPANNTNWPSDITVWINDTDIGTWMCPGDFGGRRGRLNSDWWPDKFTQYGHLKTWMIDESGSHVDDVIVGSACINDLGVTPESSVSVRIGIKEDALNQGGLNLFGRRFGDYPQDLIIRYHYKMDSLD